VLVWGNFGIFKLRLTIGLGHDVVHCLLDCDIISMYISDPASERTAVDGIGLLVGDLNAEFLPHCQICLPSIARGPTNLLNCHDHLYGIQTVETEVVVEVRFGVQLQNISLCLQSLTRCW